MPSAKALRRYCGPGARTTELSLDPEDAWAPMVPCWACAPELSLDPEDARPPMVPCWACAPALDSATMTSARMKQDRTRQWLPRAMVHHPALLVSITLPASRGNSLLLVSCTWLMTPLTH